MSHRDGLKPLFGSGFVLVAILFTLFATMRAISMLGRSPNNPLLPVSFVLMVLCPFVFLTSSGRRLMGLKKPTNGIWMVWGVLLGGLAATACFLVGFVLFGYSADNWFVSVQTYYAATAQEMPEMSIWALFMVFTIPALIFSPLGEEFFFRGFAQTTLEQRIGPNRAMFVVALAFAAIHLIHHGIARNDGEFLLFFVSGSLWFGLIFGTSILFEICRRRTGSIWAAVICHMSFNLFMNIAIFMFLFGNRA